MEYQWWQEGVFYHIYVRSFQDSDADGIGDLKGLINRLPYLKELGIDGIWLSPIFSSPNADFGYDVSDYLSIQNEYGTLEDVKILLKEAHQLNIKVLFDLVLNHTSIEHQWFVESKKSKDNSYSDYYIWSDEIPNNWMGAFGGRAWSFCKERNQYYMHSFLREQPDLNWRNQEMVDELFNMVRYWLDLGVDGFRLDVINSIVKDESLRNNPKIIGSRPRPYDLQRHIFDRNRPESHHRVRQLRKVMDEYENRMLIGEIMVELPGEPELAASYLGIDSDELHLSFDFSLAYARFSAVHWKRIAKRWYEAVGRKRWPAWVLNNHDLPRFSEKVRGDLDKLKLAALFLLTQRGAIFLYYGEELGLPNSRIHPKKMQDPLGRKYWPFHRGRDLARGPMIWSTGVGSGFTDGEPWLDVAKSANYYSVENQNLEEHSLLNFYRNIIAMRKEDEVLRRGACTFLDCNNPKILSYTRVLDREQRLVVLNMSRNSQYCVIAEFLVKEEGAIRPLFSTHVIEVSEGSGGSRYELAPYQGIIFEVES